MTDQFLLSKQKYTINKVNSIMKQYSMKNYDIKFRDGKKTTAGTLLTDPITKHKTFIFSNYYLRAFTQRELTNLIKHECAHAISGEQHSEKFREISKKLYLPKKWQMPKVDGIAVYSEML